MTMKPYTANLPDVLQWQYNKATKLQSIVSQKDMWYTQFYTNFWKDWYSKTFNLKTSENFGFLIWCLILGLPASLFGLFSNNRFWAFDSKRQNFYYYINGTDPKSAKGGNFLGTGTASLLKSEVRSCLKMRYYTLISNGNVAFINRALADAFGPFDLSAKKYLFVCDANYSGTATKPATAPDLEYHIGPGLNLSTNLTSAIQNTPFGRLVFPAIAGGAVTFTLDT